MDIIEANYGGKYVPLFLTDNSPIHGYSMIHKLNLPCFIRPHFQRLFRRFSQRQQDEREPGWQAATHETWLVYVAEWSEDQATHGL